MKTAAAMRFSKAAAGSPLEAGQETQAILARKTCKSQSGVQGADIMLVGQVRCVQRCDKFRMLPGHLCSSDIAAGEMISERRILKQCRPLRADVAKIHARRQRVFITQNSRYCAPTLNVKLGA